MENQVEETKKKMIKDLEFEVKYHQEKLKEAELKLKVLKVK